MDTLTPSLEQLQRENTELRQELRLLRDQLDWFRRQIFGKRSEKIVDTPGEVQLELFPGFTGDLTAKIEEKIVPAHTRKVTREEGKDKITFPEDLPVERHFLDVPEEEKICPSTGKPLIKIGEEVTQKLACRPGCFFIKEIIRPKYANPTDSDKGILTALLPDSLLTRCLADESLLADILVKKYVDHLPLYRISEIYARQNINISRQTLCNWVTRVGAAIKPLYDEMKRQIYLSGNAFVDETPVKMLDPGRGHTSTGFMWVLVGGKSSDPPNRIYVFRKTRQHSNAADLLKDFDGVLHSDKYRAYESLAISKKFTWCPCWAHIRRKFFDAENGDPPFRQWVLRQIRYLFMFERIAWSRSPEERLEIRRTKEAPIIDELIQRIEGRFAKGNLLPKSAFLLALGYFIGLIPYIKNYIQHPWARIDNNVAERAVRPLTIGRKNWLFIGSEGGGEAAAAIYSLVQSCRAIGINPAEYLEDVMRRLNSHSSRRLDELLPYRWAEARKQA